MGVLSPVHLVPVCADSVSGPRQRHDLQAPEVTTLPYSASHFTASLCATPTRSAKTDILTINDVAEYLKVTERTIYRLAAAKKTPAFKVGGGWRFSRADINDWIKEQSAVESTGNADKEV